MASTYTPLGIELQATGENAGTWGTKTNTNLQIIEQISGGYSTSINKWWNSNVICFRWFNWCCNVSQNLRIFHLDSYLVMQLYYSS